MKKGKEGGSVKHRQLPWFTIKNDKNPAAKYRIDNRIDIDWANFGQICYADQVNAEFICRACNSHYELLEICKEMAKQLSLSGSYEYSKTLANEAQRRIAKAEEQE